MRPPALIFCNAVLFDLDGVLIDSTPAVARVWGKWAQKHGFDPDDVIRHAHGRPSITTIREYLPGGDHELENRDVERAEIDDLGGVVALPGARELLASLAPDSWTIVTSGTRTLAEVRIRAAQLTVPKIIVTASDVTNGKPDPEPYLKGASLLGVAATKSVVIEDAPAGIRAGKAAGAIVIAVTTTAPIAELQTVGADWIVEGCQSIHARRVSGQQIVLELQNPLQAGE
jgi:sugar-phosphatase